MERVNEPASRSCAPVRRRFPMPISAAAGFLDLFLRETKTPFNSAPGSEYSASTSPVASSISCAPVISPALEQPASSGIRA
jgi:hypothetical protein